MAWCAVQLHLDRMVNYSRYFWDKGFNDPLILNRALSSGQDETGPAGLDGAYQVLFYAGEGDPDSFQARGGTAYVDLARFSFGDGAGRYLFMLSCNLFAHGPRSTDALEDFTSPQSFKTSRIDTSKTFSETGYEADVFYRWGKNYDGRAFRSPLHPSLRLACGGSTRIGYFDHSTHLFWGYLSKGLGPADSFLLGLYDPERPTVPLCISRGDTYQKSGLTDPTFVKEALVPEPAAHFPSSIYIEYPVPGDLQDPLFTDLKSRSAQQGPPAEDGPAAGAPKLPVLVVGPALVPSFLKYTALPVEPALISSLLEKETFDTPLRKYGFHGDSAQALGLDLGFTHLFPKAPFRANHLCVERHPGSGALLFSWRPIVHEEDSGSLPPVTRNSLDKVSEKLFSRLLAELPAGPAPADNGRPVIVPGDPVAIQMQIDGAPKEQNLPDDDLRSQTISHDKGCFYVVQPLIYRDGMVEVPILGEGVLAKRCPSDVLNDETFSPDPQSANDTCGRMATPLFSLSYDVPVLKEPKKGLSQKTRQTAEAEAWIRLEEISPPRSAYEQQPRVRWGYRAAPAHCTQEEMYLVYRFSFYPKDPTDKEHHVVTIEVPAHDLPVDPVSHLPKRIEDTWECSPE